MTDYIDGFAFPISRDRIAEYKRVAEQVAGIYLEHGAIEYQEYLGDDLNREGTSAFPALLSTAQGETVVFGWISYDSRETRDLVNRKIEADSRMATLVAPIMGPDNPVFEPSRMAFGGFRSLLPTGNDR